MGKIPSKLANITIGGVALEDEINKFDLKMEQETSQVNGISSVGPERVVGNYDWSASAAGNCDFAASQGDATYFAQIGDADGAALAFDPTGASAGTNDPNYDATGMVLKSYSISVGVGQPQTYSVEFEGSSALARNTT